MRPANAQERILTNGSAGAQVDANGRQLTRKFNGHNIIH
jgi:hypothetical protein